MEKIFTFIRQGRGIGALFLLAGAVLITLMFVFTAKNLFNEIRPKLVLTASDFLPITVRGGKIVEPANAYKAVTLDLGDSGDVKNLFPVVLDTRAETPDTPKERYGLFVTSDMIYLVSPTQIRKFSLQDGVWTIAEFENFLDYFAGTFSFVITVIMIVAFFVGGLLKAWIASLIGLLALKLAKKGGILDMAALMRLNALLVAGIGVLVYAVTLYGNFSMTGIQSFIILVLLEFLYLYKEGTQENA